MAKLIIEVEREGYSPNQIRSTMTVGELMDMLANFDEDSKVYFSHDRGYTYGGVKYDAFEEREDEEDECEADE